MCLLNLWQRCTTFVKRKCGYTDKKFPEGPTIDIPELESDYSEPADFFRLHLEEEVTLGSNDSNLYTYPMDSCENIRDVKFSPDPVYNEPVSIKADLAPIKKISELESNGKAQTVPTRGLYRSDSLIRRARSCSQLFENNNHTKELQDANKNSKIKEFQDNYDRLTEEVRHTLARHPGQIIFMSPEINALNLEQLYAKVDKSTKRKNRKDFVQEHLQNLEVLDDSLKLDSGSYPSFNIYETLERIRPAADESNTQTINQLTEPNKESSKDSANCEPSRDLPSLPLEHAFNDLNKSQSNAQFEVGAPKNNHSNVASSFKVHTRSLSASSTNSDITGTLQELKEIVEEEKRKSGLIDDNEEDDEENEIETNLVDRLSSFSSPFNTLKERKHLENMPSLNIHSTFPFGIVDEYSLRDSETKLQNNGRLADSGYAVNSIGTTALLEPIDETQELNHRVFNNLRRNSNDQDKGESEHLVVKGRARSDSEEEARIISEIMLTPIPKEFTVATEL